MIKKSPIIILILFLTTLCFGNEKIVFNKIEDGAFMFVKYQCERNSNDTFLLYLNKDYKFKYEKKGGKNNSIVMIGNWELINNKLELTNKYPISKLLDINQFKIDHTCIDGLLNFYLTNGQLSRNFFLDFNHNSYFSNDIINFSKNDTSELVTIYSLDGNFHSSGFNLPSNGCFNFKIDLEIESTEYYNRQIKKMIFLKNGNQLILEE